MNTSKVIEITIFNNHLRSNLLVIAFLISLKSMFVIQKYVPTLIYFRIDTIEVLCFLAKSVRHVARIQKRKTSNHNAFDRDSPVIVLVGTRAEIAGVGCNPLQLRRST